MCTIANFVLQVIKNPLSTNCCVITRVFSVGDTSNFEPEGIGQAFYLSTCFIEADFDVTEAHNKQGPAV